MRPIVLKCQNLRSVTRLERVKLPPEVAADSADSGTPMSHETVIVDDHGAFLESANEHGPRAVLEVDGLSHNEVVDLVPGREYELYLVPVKEGAQLVTDFSLVSGHDADVVASAHAVQEKCRLLKEDRDRLWNLVQGMRAALDEVAQARSNWIAPECNSTAPQGTSEHKEDAPAFNRNQVVATEKCTPATIEAARAAHQQTILESTPPAGEDFHRDVVDARGPVNARECLCRLGRPVQNCAGDKCRGERCKGMGRSHRWHMISLCELCSPETSAR